MPGPAPLRAGCHQRLCEADLLRHTGERSVTLGAIRQWQRLAGCAGSRGIHQRIRSHRWELMVRML